MRQVPFVQPFLSLHLRRNVPIEKVGFLFPRRFHGGMFLQEFPQGGRATFLRARDNELGKNGQCYRLIENVTGGVLEWGY